MWVLFRVGWSVCLSVMVCLGVSMCDSVSKCFCLCVLRVNVCVCDVKLGGFYILHVVMCKWS